MSTQCFSNSGDSTISNHVPFAGLTSSVRDVVVLIVDDSAVDRQLAGSILAKGLRARVLFAADGSEALELMRKDVPDIVITDMHMPALDGLSLVREVRSMYPSVPTILITAHGSEETAIAALQSGAASYVPKRNLAKRLVDTVRDVLEISGGGRIQSRLHAFWGRTEFEFVLENDTSLIPSLVAHLQQYSASIRLTDETEQLRVNIALHEALRNAMHHGNLELSSELRQINPDAYYEEAERRRHIEPFSQRRVYFRIHETPTESRYHIRDEGAGFNVAKVEYDPTDPMHLESPSGRGLFLMRMFMDEIRYNEIGNELTMIHRRGLPAPQEQATPPT